MQHYQPARQRPKTFAIAGVALALLLVGALALIYYFTGYVPERSRAEATAVAATHVAQVATTTAIQTTATAQAQADIAATVVSQRQNSYDIATHRQLTLYTSLVTPTPGNWATGQGCTFTQGAYHAFEPRQGFFLPCSANATYFSNFAYQVQMKIIKGDSGGVIFRADASVSRFYVFRVSRDGTYDIYYYANSTGKKVLKLAQGYSNLIRSGIEKVNQLTVLAQNAMIYVYINGTYLASMLHRGPAVGLIGVIADSSTQPTEVAYSQVRVWKL